MTEYVPHQIPYMFKGVHLDKVTAHKIRVLGKVT